VKGANTMKDKELKLNGSGYYDEPCYQTIKNVDVPKPGEIYIHADTGKYVLVLNCVNGVCAILNLTEQEREGRIPVMARVQMYTNPIMINYTFTTTLGQYVKSMPYDEFDKIQRAVADVLGIYAVSNYIKELEVKAAGMLEEHNERDALREKVKALEEENKKLQADHDMAVAIADDLHAEQIELSKDLDKETYKAEFYRGMYDALLDKVISARGEA